MRDGPIRLAVILFPYMEFYPKPGKAKCDHLKDAEGVLRNGLDHDGPAVIQAVVDDEPPVPGKISVKQALHFAEAIARGGERNPGETLKTIAVDKIREVV